MPMDRTAFMSVCGRHFAFQWRLETMNRQCRIAIVYVNGIDWPTALTGHRGLNFDHEVDSIGLREDGSRVVRTR